MEDKWKIYETMGELLYAVAMADGVIQPEETTALDKLLEGHAWAKEIKWSFDYETSKAPKVEEIYKKVISFCHGNGPSSEYQEFIDAMKVIAEAADGVSESESKIINSFSSDLLERFQRDLDKIARN